MTHALNELYQRDLDKAIEEISLFENETDLWKIGGDIKNSAGNLALHMAGNLLHFIGAQLGGSGYVRNREFEFAGMDVSRDVLIAGLQEAKKIIGNVLPSLTKDQLESIGENPFGMTNEKFLLHLYSHLSYHLGQVNYHRRLLR